jgi:chemotaxis protein MotB
MLAFRPAPAWALAASVLLVSGCTLVPVSEWKAVRGHNDELTKLKKEQEAQIENLEVHSRNLLDQLERTEEDLALLEEQLGLDRRRLANYREERDLLRDNFQKVAAGMAGVSPEVGNRLAEISRRSEALDFDPLTGVAKLQTDILFDVGTAELKSGAEGVVRELVALLKTPEARDLRVMVAGHTDDRRVAKSPARDRYRDNFHLSTDRALAVSELLVRAGLEESRMGVAGFGAHQPVAPNVSDKDRQKNRRVEIFVMAPQVPVVGWTETIPSVY